LSKFLIIRQFNSQIDSQRFIHARLLKAREYAWPQVAQRIMNYYQALLDERGSSSMRPRSRAL